MLATVSTTESRLLAGLRVEGQADECQRAPRGHTFARGSVWEGGSHHPDGDIPVVATEMDLAFGRAAQRPEVGIKEMLMTKAEFLAQQKTFRLLSPSLPRAFQVSSLPPEPQSAFLSLTFRAFLVRCTCKCCSRVREWPQPTDTPVGSTGPLQASWVAARRFQDTPHSAFPPGFTHAVPSAERLSLQRMGEAHSLPRSVDWE